MEKRLTKPQEKQLFYKCNTGDFLVHRWETIRVLFEKGYVKENPRTRYIECTPKAKAYLDRHHMDIDLRGICGCK